MVVLHDWVDAVAATLPSPFTGKIEVNCVDDGVAVVNVLVSFKPPRRDTTKISLDRHHRLIVAVKQEP